MDKNLADLQATIAMLAGIIFGFVGGCAFWALLVAQP